ncbi:TIGR01212 family radical SAM protein [Culicoidibacter larvae]|uniref:TIGR01212 family radical SAM protein n=1 Tax=Culicoidibacter larvae TaxID=2579976 RepID=A0A5R8QBN4_9FIRM|nr:TIGR01212 family radical SAM protein [Culicoidibacter larvae]TLG72512.1 TIGR01212 family radical SAM protein [Culicoidibacter larvae]
MRKEKIKNPFPYSNDNRRIHTWNYHLQETFGGKVAKVSLNAGFTCPNIDGRKSKGGCTFCSINGSGDFAGNPADDLVRQFNVIRDRYHDKWPDANQFIAYFQAFTNTYAPVEVLREKYEAVLALDGVVGLAIATRADCLEDDVVEYLAELNERTYLWVELGLQTIHDRTAKKINRGHTYQEFLDGVAKLRARNIRVCVHIINGLPGEDIAMMQATAEAMAELDIQGIKIHLLHVLKNTTMAKMHKYGKLEFMEQDEYVNLVVNQLEILPPELIIHRITGDGGHEDLIGPLWSLKKFVVMNEIDKRFIATDSWQGKKYRGGMRDE